MKLIIYYLSIILIGLNLTMKIKDNYVKTNYDISTNLNTNNSTNFNTEERLMEASFINYQNRICVAKQYQAIGLKNNKDDMNIPKANLDTKQKFLKRGGGQTGYLFDFLDDLFQDHITKYFTRIWNLAKEIEIKDKSYVDPYDLSSVLTSVSRKLMTNILDLDIDLDHTKMSEKEITARMMKVSPLFNYTVYNNSIDAKRINALVNEWGYFKKIGVSDFAKYVIDKYDMDGDGRLNPREFILFTIYNNKQIFGSLNCKRCFLEDAQKLIFPIFDFLDCNGINVVSVEEICDGISFLKRTIPDQFNMFTCKLQGETFRITSCNEFILKNEFKEIGLLSRNEFALGLLLGYWDRQTDNMNIYLGDEKNKKFVRWSKDGRIDIFCENLKKFS